MYTISLLEFFVFWLVWVSVGIAIGYNIARSRQKAHDLEDLEYRVAEEYDKIKSKKDDAEEA